MTTPTAAGTATTGPHLDPATPADPLAGLTPLISVETAAEVLGFSRASAYRYAKAGQLPVRRIGGRVYVVTAELRALLTPDSPTAGGGV
ncbi:helix-turn-helix domain-containing protein [Protofrankia symbiont of Coriaria ruscifolia]|uniref:helix-turn-helix domain-containing protein n=1 Tax=Protofrankia symbiont of Coriaria ruscifolia TaxID=1306542 RepID=UPI0010414CE4|nr:helix-turn-helix domain-containing protein [Protofrankia symbiont of Coriaria ruscifolia]